MSVRLLLSSIQTLKQILNIGASHEVVMRSGVNRKLAGIFWTPVEFVEPPLSRKSNASLQVFASSVPRRQAISTCRSCVFWKRKWVFLSFYAINWAVKSEIGTSPGCDSAFLGTRRPASCAGRNSKSSDLTTFFRSLSSPMTDCCVIWGWCHRERNGPVSFLSNTGLQYHHEHAHGLEACRQAKEFIRFLLVFGVWTLAREDLAPRLYKATSLVKMQYFPVQNLLNCNISRDGSSESLWSVSAISAPTFTF